MNNTQTSYKIIQTDIGASCRATRKIFQNSIIFESMGSIEDKASKHSVQIDANRHLLANNDLIYVNHSFNPNCHMKIFADPPKLQLVALRDIESDEDLSFNYNTSEWELSCPFQDCNTQKYVTGCKFLDAQEIKKIWPLLSDWIKEKIKIETPHLVQTQSGSVFVDSTIKPTSSV